MAIQNHLYFFILSLCLIFTNFLQADKVTIICPSKSIPFRAEIPLTAAEKAKGLMFRETLNDDVGMLFLFPNAEKYPPSMWMKNTSLPLDMIFADKNGAILEIFENTIPYSEATIGPVLGTTQVFEINAGLSKKHSITKGCVLRRE